MQVLDLVQVSQLPIVQRHRASSTVVLFPVCEMQVRRRQRPAFVCPPPPPIQLGFFLPEIEVGVKSLKLFRPCLSFDEGLISRTCAFILSSVKEEELEKEEGGNPIHLFCG